jgi:hypothetical protein
MKSLLVLLALLTASTTAYAGSSAPFKKNLRCWAVTDSSRGFGYWDQCVEEKIKVERQEVTYLRARTQPDEPPGGSGDGGGGGGGR